MSRSRKKTPICGMSTSISNKQFKRQENRRFRHQVRQDIHCGKEILPHHKKYGNEWDSPRDGKQWFGDSNPQWFYPEDYTRLMRK